MFVLPIFTGGYGIRPYGALSMVHPIGAVINARPYGGWCGSCGAPYGGLSKRNIVLRGMVCSVARGAMHARKHSSAAYDLSLHKMNYPQPAGGFLTVP